MAQALAQTGVEKWDAVLLKAGADMCAALAMGRQVASARRDELPIGRLGACIPLVGPLRIQLVVLSTNKGVREIAERFLRIDDSDEPLSGDDVKDAFAELANQFAGLTKRGLPNGGKLRLGLPVFVRGTLKPASGVQVNARDVRWGDTEVTLALLVSA